MTQDPGTGDGQVGTDPAIYPKTAFIVSHTHWDREWYLSFNTFRVKLSRVVKQVLDLLENDPDFDHFLMDGQAIVLEDHLRLHPEDESRIRAQVESGHLSIGPWYMLPDEFLISAESSIRNLLIGRQVCDRFGGAQQAGYMADSFGHPAQVPQLLRQAGIASFIYQRGNGDELDEVGLEYDWVAPDGSRVLALQQWQGYCNAAGLGFEEIWHAHTQRTLSLDLAESKIRDLFSQMGRRSNGSVALLNNGCDHFPPQQEFGSVLARLRSAFPNVVFKHTGLEEVVAAVQKDVPERKSYRGELLGGKFSHILSGVWSARMYLKQWNDRCQTLLSSQLEPLLTYDLFRHGRTYPSGLVTHLWKRLLENHPHDSICGCSIDEVHDDMMPRFREVVESSEEALVGVMDQWCPTFARVPKDDEATVLCVANPLPVQRTEVMDRLVVLQPCCSPTETLRLFDEAGEEVEFQIVDSWFVERFWGIDYRRMLHTDEQLDRFAQYRAGFGERMLKERVETELTDRYLWIQFLARDLPACGHRLFRFVGEKNEDGATGTGLATAAICAEDTAGTGDTSAGIETTETADTVETVGTVETVETVDTTVRKSGFVLENEFVKIRVHENATIDMRCKQTDRVYYGLNLLEDREDIGDEYDYSPAEQSDTRTVEPLTGTRRIVFANDLAAAVEVSLNWTLPEGLTQDRGSRSLHEKDCRAQVTVTLHAESPIVDFDVRFENEVRDHRLRARFPFRIEADRIWSDGHFYTNARPLRPTSGEDWVQPSPGPYPQQDFSLLQDKLGGVAVLNRGLPEIEVRQNPGTQESGLDLTLLRAVGWLSRDDFPTRRSQNAGPTIPTPAAQCIGPQRFRYALLPFAGDWRKAEIKSRSQQWHVPNLLVQGVEDGSVAGGAGLIECLGSGVSVTSIKKHETRDSIVVRLYNLMDDEAEATLRLLRPIQQAWMCGILEDRKDPIEPKGRALSLRVPAHRIVTVEAVI